MISRLSQSAATSRLSNIAACVAHKLAQPSASWRSGGCLRRQMRLQAAPAPAILDQPLGRSLDMEHDSRQASCMKAGFELHSPSAAQVRQLSLVSMHSSDGEALPDASTCACTTSCA